MLFLLIGVLVLASVLVLCVKKTKESLYLTGMCVSLAVQFAGILIFIAKKGGYSRDVLRFLFFSLDIKNSVQYLYLRLGTIGYLIAVGRYLFPLFLMLMALHYSMIPWLRHHPGIRLWVAVPPVLSLVFYTPGVYRALVDAFPAVQGVLVQASYLWVMGYVLAALALLIHEYFSITMRFCRRQFSLIVICMMALSGLYVLYCGQDPGQVYRFYSYDYIWYKGLGYLQYAPGMAGYMLLVVGNVICGALGFSSLLRYTQGSFVSDRDDVVMERKFDIARSGASVFVHSIKNQLLANRVLYKRLYQELEKPEPNLARVRESVDALHGNNEMLITRSEELYRTVKSKSVQLVPVSLPQLGETTLQRFYKKYPEGRVEVRLAWETEVLADKNYLSEALYNLLTNAWEATLAAGRADCPVQLLSHAERLYTVLEVRDCGLGIPRAEQKKIFEPFYSSKNTNFNWGMGLYHVRAIVKSHLGSLRMESEEGKGTSFFVLLPKYGQEPKREGGKA